MPEMKIYRPEDALPADYECQIRAFIRMLWHDEYAYNIDAPFTQPERHVSHVVFAERHALFSYARVNWVNVEHAGQTYRLYCLGDVFTYPAFRKRGYGRQVVDVGTKLIRADADTDAAILFTDPELEKFYAQSGWEHIAGLNSTKGGPEHPEPQDGSFVMMLFLSDKAKQHRTDFETHTLNLPGYGW
jgi:predicted GNAT family N-acyltransferase